MRGLAHYQESVEAGKDKDEAADEGLEIAVFGTFKGIVDLAELIFKVVCFVFYPLVWLAKRLG